MRIFDPSGDQSLTVHASQRVLAAPPVVGTISVIRELPGRVIATCDPSGSIRANSAPVNVNCRSWSGRPTVLVKDFALHNYVPQTWVRRAVAAVARLGFLALSVVMPRRAEGGGL